MSAPTATATETAGNERLQLSESAGFLAGPLMLAGAVVLLLTAIASHWSDGGRFWHAYLLGAAYVGSFSIGGLFFTMAHHLFGGRWGTTIRRLAECVASTMWSIVLLFAPIALVIWFGNKDLYPWLDEGYLHHEPVVAGKDWYLTKGFFLARMVVYFVLWMLLTSYFTGVSLKQDQTGDVGRLRSLQRWSGPGMVLFALTLNFAAFDWLMSLDPLWFSTIFGVYYWVGAAISLLALVIILAYFLQSSGVLTQSITTEHYHDLSKLMFAMVVFWGYTAFSQYLLIWYANIPEETGWYALRQPGGPTYFGLSTMTGLLFILHLFVPFLGFMSRKLRRNKHVMVGWAFYLLAVHWFDLFYVVMPTLQVYNDPVRSGVDHAAFPFGLLETLCTIGCVCVFAGALLRALQGKLLMAARDPRVNEALSYHNA